MTNDDEISFKSNTEIKITLAPADPNLAEWWFHDRQDAETLRFNPLASSTIGTLRERLSKASSDLGSFETSESFFWFVKTGDQIVGHVTIQNINRTMLTAEIGYGISLPWRGQGLATLTIRKLVSDVFSHTPLRKLIAFVHEENVSSRKTLEKAGFQLEGVLREHYLVNGLPANEAIYGLLRAEA